ncbi:hypothetical protein MKX01_036562 [Papaver californicum]|nr:hypothetical protein MKX01_036562 [Papaver californicum]
MADKGITDEDDYMADLSIFLPPETSQNPSKVPLRKKNLTSKPITHEPSNKTSKTLNWQEQRKLDRERKQREEDEKTLTNMESAIPQSNIGFKMLKQMGYIQGLIVEFGSRQKLQWKSRRLVYNYHKATAVLDQLENKEIIEPIKKEGEDEEEEEEEEIITEEDLLEILVKLWDKHRYCPFCGCQYEPLEALSLNCPGIDEDDH